MSFPQSVTLNGVMAVTLRYFTEFGEPVYQHITPTSLGFCSACIRCRRKESSRSLSHLLMSFLLTHLGL